MVTFSRCRIHERTISLRFLGITLIVPRLEISLYNDYITNQFETTFAHGGGGGVNFVVEVTLNSKEENSEDFCPNDVQEFCLWKLFLIKHTVLYIVHIQSHCIGRHLQYFYVIVTKICENV
jgi:hypothetical protein